MLFFVVTSTTTMPGIKIIIMGVGGVGKSAITKRLVIGSWEEKVRRMCFS